MLRPASSSAVQWDDCTSSVFAYASMKGMKRRGAVLHGHLSSGQAFLNNERHRTGRETGRGPDRLAIQMARTARPAHNSG